MGLIASTSPVWTPITTVGGGLGSGGTITPEFYDNSGQNFKWTHSGSTYQGFRLQSPYHRNFRMSFQWRGSNGCAYFGAFWGNTSGTDIWGSSSTGLKVISYPVSGSTFRWHLRDTNGNQERFINGLTNSADQNDGSTWHTTVIEVIGKCCRVWHNGTDAMTAGFNQYGGTTFSNQMNQAGNVGLLLYTGTVEVRNFTIVDLPLNSTGWEHIMTHAPTSSQSSFNFNNIFDQGYTRIKVSIQSLIAETDNCDYLYRVTDESGNDWSTHYYYGATVQGSEASQDGDNWRGANQSEGKFWEGNWSNSMGGAHGDIIIDNYTLSHKTMNNTMSRRGNYSNMNRPIARFDMYGYMHSGNMADGSTPSGYCRQSGQIRYNQGRSPSSYGGFRLYPSTGNWAPDPEINIYGMRSPAY